MGKIFYLEGSRAVGKTTLLKNIRRYAPNIIVIDGYARKDFMFDTTRLEEFIINEKLYLACALAQYAVLKEETSPTVIVKGPYTDVYYAERYMKKVFPMQDITKTALYPYIEEIKKSCAPDAVIYLDAPIEIIKKRYAEDSRSRKTMNEFLSEWLLDFEQHFKSMPFTKVLDTSDKDELTVYSKFMNMLAEV